MRVMQVWNGVYLTMLVRIVEAEDNQCGPVDYYFQRVSTISYYLSIIFTIFQEIA